MWDAPPVSTERDAALVEEACRKSAMSWLRPAGASRSTMAWHIWHEGALYVVSGGLEQPLPPMPDGEPLTVTVRSKDNGSRLVAWVGVATTVEPGTPEWDSAVPELHAKRLNPTDGEQQPLRWARESTVTRIAPTGVLLEGPGRMPHRSHAAEPPSSPATTRGALPFVVGRRARRRR
jgi:hypothetical protein